MASRHVDAHRSGLERVEISLDERVMRTGDNQRSLLDVLDPERTIPRRGDESQRDIERRGRPGVHHAPDRPHGARGLSLEHKLDLAGREFPVRLIVPDELSHAEWLQIIAFVERRAIIAETSELAVGGSGS